MNNNQKAYIAGIGMISPLGVNAEMTAASIKAKMSAYKTSQYTNQCDHPITMTGIPKEVFSSIQIDIDEGNYYRKQYDHIIKMAVIALKNIFTSPNINIDSISRPIPLILAMPEPDLTTKQISSEMLINKMINLSNAPIDSEQVHCVHTGRAAGVQGLEIANRYLYELGHDYVIIGSSDSYWNLSLIDKLSNADRLLSSDNQDGFAPGEASCFLLLSRRPENAINDNNQIIALNSIGIADEEGHFESEIPYKGEGLNQAITKTLKDYSSVPISAIYTSMNGENFWAKELGVAMLRNNQYFQENIAIEHPADCLGDLGSATGTSLIGLSALELLKQAELGTHLVYSSSDGAKRASVLVEKISFNKVV